MTTQLVTCTLIVNTEALITCTLIVNTDVETTWIPGANRDMRVLPCIGDKGTMAK
jgi:hypothetical protein